MGLSLRGLPWRGAVLVGASFFTLQRSCSGAAPTRMPRRQPAAMTPENQIEADEGDHHEGYYYPKPAASSITRRGSTPCPESDRVRRQAFVIGLTKQLVGGQYAPSYAIFAKGNASDKLIIVALVDGQLNTIYRARALLATFTSVARSTVVLPAEHPAGRSDVPRSAEAAGVQAGDAQRRARLLRTRSSSIERALDGTHSLHPSWPALEPAIHEFAAAHVRLHGNSWIPAQGRDDGSGWRRCEMSGER